MSHDPNLLVGSAAERYGARGVLVSLLRALVALTAIRRRPGGPRVPGVLA